MEIYGIQSGIAGQIFRSGTDPGKGADSGSTGLPASWGPDTVSISEEALAAVRAAQKAAENSGSSEEDKDVSETEQAFADYMTRKRSKAVGSDSESLEGKLKELEDKLKALESELAAVASKGKTDEATMSQVEQLTTQIEAVTAQLTELMSQMAKKNGQP